MSILTDFYNLKLTTNFYNIDIERDGHPDKDIIIQFFEKHAPNVLEFYEYTTAEGKIISRKDVKPHTDPFGTLWMFETNNGHSWFRSAEYGRDFLQWHNRLHHMIDSYLATKSIKRNMLTWIPELLADLRPELFFMDKDDNLYGTSRDLSARGPREINIGEYSFYEALTTSNKDQNKLNLDAFKQGLFLEIRNLLNGDKVAKRCDFNGAKRLPPCEEIFIQRTSCEYNQELC